MPTKIVIRHPVKGPFERVRFATEGESRTKQEFRDDCDINLILARFEKTRVIDHHSVYGERYSEVLPSTLLEAYQTVEEAESMFMDLPARTRKKFANDPAAFLGFVQDEANLDEMAEMGLLDEKSTKAFEAAKAAQAAAEAASEASAAEDGGE